MNQASSSTDKRSELTEEERLSSHGLSSSRGLEEEEAEGDDEEEDKGSLKEEERPSSHGLSSSRGLEEEEAEGDDEEEDKGSLKEEERPSSHGLSSSRGLEEEEVEGDDEEEEEEGSLVEKFQDEAPKSPSPITMVTPGAYEDEEGEGSEEATPLAISYKHTRRLM
ncbi:cilia- and flagella-associated protein 251-like [Oncorhynchus tshawytscha]|uniref:cilia- and flagella-associated protein 251-like n=1 Tax=Oncorhynchus tshawytscha TaxID=74940 RepID=UPI001C3E4BC6|nr:cilia- and flagella-associated protein 251-like [Oncorhynchus tshawytscha]